MPKFPRDVDHLVRIAALFVAGSVVFVVARSFLIPKDFYELGHFRTGALADNMAPPLVFAGRAACEGCHPDVVDERKGSRHDAIACEACHGALAKHAADPGSLKPTRPDPRKLCLMCHHRDMAKPSSVKQVNPEEHMGAEPCVACHKPHHPKTA